MVDPYTPKLEAFTFTEEENDTIQLALATEKPWDWKPSGASGDNIKSVKTKIRDFHMMRHNSRCCYCRRDLNGGGHFMIDREHILPKSLEPYRLLAFSIWNLSTSCKRCNMEYKRDDDSFVVDKDNPELLEDSENYLLIHPNFDCYKDHISKSSYEDDDVVVVKFTKREGSAKGAFTYDYFNLSGLERQVADEAQGALVIEEPSEAGFEVRRLAEELGQ